MARVYLGVGSNIERERYIVAGLDALQGLFGEVARPHFVSDIKTACISRVYSDDRRNEGKP